MAKLDDIQELDANIQFEIARPNGRGSLFRLRYRVGSYGPRKTLQLDEIDIANRLYDTNVVDFETTHQKIRDIRALLYKKRKQERKKHYTDHNMSLLDKYWTAKYTARRRQQMKKPEKSREDLERAISAAGNLPLDTCSLEMLEEQVFEMFDGRPTVLHKRIMWLNSILMWLGRPKLAQLSNKDRLAVTYVTEGEFLQLVDLIQDPLDQTVARIAFYSGLRLGEIFGLSSRDIKADHIHVSHQMYDKYDDYRIAKTKTSAERDALLAPQIQKELSLFAALSIAEKRNKRDTPYCKIINKICEQLWPNDPDKQLSFHALRHSNAIWLLHKGASIHEVAQHLGNRLEVTERYYSGFILKKESITRLRALVGA